MIILFNLLIKKSERQIMSTLRKLYKYSQIPAALCIGYIIRKDAIENKQPEIISNISGVTIGIICSYVWPGMAMAYGYVKYNDQQLMKQYN